MNAAVKNQEQLGCWKEMGERNGGKWRKRGGRKGGLKEGLEGGHYFRSGIEKGHNGPSQSVSVQASS